VALCCSARCRRCGALLRASDARLVVDQRHGVVAIECRGERDVEWLLVCRVVCVCVCAIARVCVHVSDRPRLQVATRAARELLANLVADAAGDEGDATGTTPTVSIVSTSNVDDTIGRSGSRDGDDGTVEPHERTLLAVCVQCVSDGNARPTTFLLESVQRSGVL
jgi:hypothetical protein